MDLLQSLWFRRYPVDNEEPLGTPEEGTSAAGNGLFPPTYLYLDDEERDAGADD